MVTMTVYLITAVNYWIFLRRIIQGPNAHGKQMALELHFNRTDPAAFFLKDTVYFVSWGLDWSWEQSLTPMNPHSVPDKAGYVYKTII